MKNGMNQTARLIMVMIAFNDVAALLPIAMKIDKKKMIKIATKSG